MLKWITIASPYSRVCHFSNVAIRRTAKITAFKGSSSNNRNFLDIYDGNPASQNRSEQLTRCNAPNYFPRMKILKTIRAHAKNKHYIYGSQKDMKAVLIQVLDSYLIDPLKLININSVDNVYEKMDRDEGYLRNSINILPIICKYSGNDYYNNTHTKTFFKNVYKYIINDICTVQNNDDVAIDKIKIKLLFYKFINIHSNFYRDVIMLPSDVHKWFYKNLSKDELYSHYYFLIQNNVKLNTCDYIKKIHQKLLQSSEFETKLVTFETFLINIEPSDTKNLEMLARKFVKLHGFNTIINLANNVVRRKNWKYLHFYLSSMVNKITDYKNHSINKINNNNNQSNKIDYNEIVERNLSFLFIRFLNELLFVLVKVNDVKSIVPIFQLIIKSLRNINSNYSLDILHKPILSIINLLRRNNAQEELFEFVSLLSSLPLSKSTKFNERIVTELLASLRSFNDLKLACGFTHSAVKQPDMSKILNDLGIWGYAFHNDTAKLMTDRLEAETKDLKPLLSQKFQIRTNQVNYLVNELYNSLFKICQATLTEEQFRDIIIDLYSKYVAKLNSSYKTFAFWKNDAFSLNIFLRYSIQYLHDYRLAYNFLTDFYSHPFVESIKVKKNNCPFSLLVYKCHKDLSITEILNLLSIMEKNSIPLTFKICCAMVLKFHEMGRLDEAYFWYQKIYYGHFQVNHIPLILIIKRNNWKFPRGFDTKLLNRLGDGSIIHSSEEANKSIDNEPGNESETNIEDTSILMGDMETRDSAYQQLLAALGSLQK